MEASTTLGYTLSMLATSAIILAAMPDHWLVAGWQRLRFGRIDHVQKEGKVVRVAREGGKLLPPLPEKSAGGRRYIAGTVIGMIAVMTLAGF